MAINAPLGRTGMCVNRLSSNGLLRQQSGCQSTSRGFTLIELMVVVTIIAIATAAVVLSLRGGSEDALETEALRLAALLEGAHAKARATGQTVVWRAHATGFTLDGEPRKWLHEDTRVGTAGDGTLTTAQVLLLPEAITPALRVTLRNTDSQRVVLSDGLHGFKVTQR